MTTLHARKYFGGNFLTIRTWDGIDKPEHDIIMNLVEEELEFVGGRFEKYDRNLIWRKPELNNKICIRIPKNKKENTEIFDWVGENIENTWAVDISEKYEDWCLVADDIDFSVFVFRFSSEQDMLKFMLRWSE